MHRLLHSPLGLAGAVLALCLAAPISVSTGAAPATHTVVIDGTAFQPRSLTVARGDTVVWVNQDPFPHTVTAAGTFDSRDIAAGKSWRYTARSPGEFHYICTLHPTMRGTLVVK